MDFEKVNRYFSEPRINRYLTATGNKQKRSIRLYKANLKIAQSFHPLLGVLEVALRNSVNRVLTYHFGDPDWIINEKTGFMSDPSLTHIDRRTHRRITNDFLKSSVEKAEKRFGRLGIPVTSGKVIADQTLGFWTDLFEVHHYRLLRGRPIKVFSFLPPGHGRKEVCDRLNTIRQFRNRINHNEPICFNGRDIDLSYAREVHTAIIEILMWIDPDLINWTTPLDKVLIKIDSAKKIENLNDWDKLLKRMKNKVISLCK